MAGEIFAMILETVVSMISCEDGCEILEARMLLIQSIVSRTLFEIRLFWMSEL